MEISLFTPMFPETRLEGNLRPYFSYSL